MSEIVGVNGRPLIEKPKEFKVIEPLPNEFVLMLGDTVIIPRSPKKPFIGSLVSICNVMSGVALQLMSAPPTKTAEPPKNLKG